MPSTRSPSRAIILGATSAVAVAVAERLVARGDRLHLVARNPDKLDAVRERLERPYSPLTFQVADFENLDQNKAVVSSAIEALGGVDTVLVAHGDLGDQLHAERSFVEAERLIRVNFLSVVSLLIPVANHMESAKAGSIGVMTSVAGDRGRPPNYTYGAAKGALGIYLQGLRSRLYQSGVSVTTLKLGPVDTPMTTEHKKTALFSTPNRIAPAIVRALDAGSAEVYLPSFWQVIMPIVKATPEGLFQRLPFLSGR